MNEQDDYGRLLSVGKCCKATDPKRPFHATLEVGDGKQVQLHVSASELLSYRRFKAQVLMQTGWLAFFPADQGGRTGRLAWHEAVRAAMAAVPVGGCR